MTSYRRRCDVITSHRREYDVTFTSCARWDRTSSAEAVNSGIGVEGPESICEEFHVRGCSIHGIHFKNDNVVVVIVVVSILVTRSPGGPVQCIHSCIYPAPSYPAVRFL